MNEWMNEWMSKMKNDWGFMPPLCKCRLNWINRTSREWWDGWNGTVLQTQDSKFEPWWCESEHATSLSRRLPSILNLYEWAGKKLFGFFKLECQSGRRTHDLRLSSQIALASAPGPLSNQESAAVVWQIWTWTSIYVLKGFFSTDLTSAGYMR